MEKRKHITLKPTHQQSHWCVCMKSVTSSTTMRINKRLAGWPRLSSNSQPVFAGIVWWFGIQLQLSKLIGDTWIERINGSNFNVSGTPSYPVQCASVMWNSVFISQFADFQQLEAVRSSSLCWHSVNWSQTLSWHECGIVWWTSKHTAQVLIYFCTATMTFNYIFL